MEQIYRPYRSTASCMHKSAYLAGNLQEQGLQTEQHVRHCSCSRFSQHQFPLISVVEPENHPTDFIRITKSDEN